MRLCVRSNAAFVLWVNVPLRIFCLLCRYMGTWSYGGFCDIIEKGKIFRVKTDRKCKTKCLSIKLNFWKKKKSVLQYLFSAPNLVKFQETYAININAKNIFIDVNILAWSYQETLPCQARDSCAAIISTRLFLYGSYGIQGLW